MIRFDHKRMAEEGRGHFASHLAHCRRISLQDWRKSRSIWQQLHQAWADVVLVGELKGEVNLVKVVADAVEHSTRADRGEVFIAQAVVAVDQVLDAIGFGQKLSAVKGININFGGGGLITADEMSRQPDAGDGQAQAPSEQNVKQAQVDGVACPAVYNAVQVTVLGVVIILLVAGEAKLLEEVLIDGGQHRLRLSIEIQPLAQFGRITVQQGLVGLDVDIG